MSGGEIVSAVEASVGVGFVHAEFGPAEDGTNHVVKVVSDPTSQLADGFKFLGLANLLFQGFNPSYSFLHE